VSCCPSLELCILIPRYRGVQGSNDIWHTHTHTHTLSLCLHRSLSHYHLLHIHTHLLTIDPVHTPTLSPAADSVPSGTWKNIWDEWCPTGYAPTSPPSLFHI
jgi:hypothetical protein